MSRLKTTKLKPPDPPEAAIQEALMRRLGQAGWLVVRFNGGGFKDSRGQYVVNYIIQGMARSAGFPDVVAFKADRFRMFEVKRQGGKLSDAQRQFQEFAGRFGVEVTTVVGWDDMEAVTECL